MFGGPRWPRWFWSAAALDEVLKHMTTGPMAVSDPSATSDEPRVIDLKDPYLAAILAWLVPGLGHVYQGRTGKGILFAVCILSTFVFGCYLGSAQELGVARVVYASWRPGDHRLYYLPQLGVGLPALPALIQAMRDRQGRAPLFGQFMAPPRLGGDRLDPPTLNRLYKDLGRNFELGTLYTAIAGLLNVLAIYDAWGGPVAAARRKSDDESPDSAPASAP